MVPFFSFSKFKDVSFSFKAMHLVQFFRLKSIDLFNLINSATHLILALVNLFKKHDTCEGVNQKVEHILTQILIKHC